MKPRQERIEVIRNTLANTSNTDQRTTRVPWREGELFLKIIKLPISSLIFNLDNFRTKRQQLDYEQTDQIPKNAFHDQESTVAQQAQFEILGELLRDTGQDLVDDLKDVGQADPAIITFDGIIINGNRRIAAMRLLGFETAECVVLPEIATRDDLYYIEQVLQVSKDFKQPYHWVNELISIDFGFNDRKKSPENLAKILRIKVADVLSKRDQKLLVDEFLEWKDIPGAYNYKMLNDVEQVFSDLEKFLHRSRFSTSLKEEAKLAVFNLIEHRPSEGRLYGHVGGVLKHFADIHEKLLKDQESEKDRETEASEAEKNSNSGDPIVDEILKAGKAEKGSGGDETLVNLDNPSQSAENTVSLIAALEEIQAEKEEENKNDSLVNGISKALKTLSGLRYSSNSTNLDEAQQKLRLIIKKSSSILEEIRTSDDQGKYK